MYGYHKLEYFSLVMGKDIPNSNLSKDLNPESKLCHPES